MRGYILLSTLFMLGTLVLLAGALMPVVMNEIDAEKGLETGIRMNDLQRAIQAYVWDTGRLPAGRDQVGLSSLIIAPSGVQGWRGPYSSYPADYGLRDPWRNWFIYRTGNINGIPVVLIGSMGRNGQLDTDLSNWPNSPLILAGDDLLRQFELDRLSEFQDEKTINVLNLTKSIIYNTFTSAPATYANPAMTDAWGRSIRYFRCTPWVAVLYSLGYDGVDDSASGSDICTNRRSGGDDLFVWLVW